MLKALKVIKNKAILKAVKRNRKVRETVNNVMCYIGWDSEQKNN